MSAADRTGIIFLLQPYSTNALKRAIRTPKLYFRDTGLACYLTRWLTADTLKNSAVAGSMFETFVISEILKSFSNEGLDYRFSVSYYRGKDRGTADENEIDLIIEENGVLYPVEIKMTGNPKASMASANPILDKAGEKKRGMGVILCLIDKKNLSQGKSGRPAASVCLKKLCSTESRFRHKAFPEPEKKVSHAYRKKRIRLSGLPQAHWYALPDRAAAEALPP